MIQKIALTYMSEHLFSEHVVSRFNQHLLGLLEAIDS